MKLIDSARFMETSLSNLVDNLTMGIHKIKCKDCDCFFEYESVKDNSIKYKYLPCSKDYSNKIDKELKKRFKNTFNTSNNDINKFILQLRKGGVYPYEYMDKWKKFNDTILPKKDEFYSNLNMKDITDAGYMDAKRVCKEFEIKNLGDIHDLYLKSDPLLLVDVFENFRKMYLKIYYLESAKFLSAPRLEWQEALKKNLSKTGIIN